MANSNAATAIGASTKVRTGVRARKRSNVRELANVMEHAWILAGGGPITTEHLPHTLRQGAAATGRLAAA